MKLTLKKASALQRLVIDTANKIQFQTTVSLSSFSTKEAADYVAEEFDGGVKKLNFDIALYQKLMEIGYGMRQKIADVNAAVDADGVSINSLLTLRARHEAEEKKFFKALSEIEEGYSAGSSQEIMVGKLLAERAQRTSGTAARYSSADSHQLTLVTDSMKNMFKSSLAYYRQAKSDVSDSVAGRNLNSYIEVSDADAEVLRNQNLIT